MAILYHILYYIN